MHENHPSQKIAGYKDNSHWSEVIHHIKCPSVKYFGKQLAEHHMIRGQITTNKKDNISYKT